MDTLANHKEFLKYIEIWNKIGALFNERFNKRGFYSRPTYNNECIKTKICSYNNAFKENKNLQRMNIMAMQYY